MLLYENIGKIYTIYPYTKSITNKINLFFSLLLGKNIIKITFKEITLKFNKSDYSLLYYFLGIISICSSFKKIKNNKLEIIVNNNCKFEIPLEQFSVEDKIMIELMSISVRSGADIVTKDVKGLRDKSFKITESNSKKIIETHDGIKFFIDQINPGNTIVETFVNNIHNMNSKIDLTNKIIVDVGAECGDTPLYFAKKGATVYAFEPMKAHFDAMMNNLKLNPKLAKNIIPINAGIGEDGMLKFFSAYSDEIGESSSFVYNVHGKNAHFSEIQGYSLESVIKKWEIDEIELLKMDCKGCEFFISEKSLGKVNQIKIEYNAKFANKKLDNILNILEKSGFNYTLYKHSVTDRISINDRGTIYGIKKECMDSDNLIVMNNSS